MTLSPPARARGPPPATTGTRVASEEVARASAVPCTLVSTSERCCWNRCVGGSAAWHADHAAGNSAGGRGHRRACLVPCVDEPVPCSSAHGAPGVSGGPMHSGGPRLQDPGTHGRDRLRPRRGNTFHCASPGQGGGAQAPLRGAVWARRGTPREPPSPCGRAYGSPPPALPSQRSRGLLKGVPEWRRHAGGVLHGDRRHHD
mmetsp:Transcript_3009/g.7631  ORF Transcript_3009/g.7631 Transcript_3009/m.7631 type:complete len:201 (-) Transcript_3009:423-1025(-)